MGRGRLSLAISERRYYFVCMADEPENLTIRLLQEIRSDVQALQRGQEELLSEVKDLTQRVDGNTLIFNLVAGVVHDHEQRIDQLEQSKS